MNQKGTPTDTKSQILLTSVQSGNVCRLVGVTDVRRSTGKHGRHWSGFGGRGKHREHISKHNKRWHERGQRHIMKRLLDLGLTRGCTFKVIQGRGRGPVLVEVRGTRIALGHGLASQVVVEVLEA
ncbi:MAG: ferrous iron transport protein A [Candidatus Thorarchaeota archaeon]